MELRTHPLMSYRHQRNWPPVWKWTRAGENKRPHGELGILKEVHIDIAPPDEPNSVRPLNRLYLFMEYRETGYVGCLLFDDASFCRQIAEILSTQCGRTIKEIGDLDLSYLL